MIQQSLLAEAKKAATIEKNKLIYLTKGENKENLIKTKEAIFSTAFDDAEQRLSHVRNDPKYPDIFKKLTREAVGALGGETFRIHIDKRDEESHEKDTVRYYICQEKSLRTFTCSGGLVVSYTERIGKNFKYS